jgi:hypothetical protein
MISLQRMAVCNVVPLHATCGCVGELALTRVFLARVVRLSHSFFFLKRAESQLSVCVSVVLKYV